MKVATSLIAFAMMVAACGDDGGFDEISLADAAGLHDSTSVDVTGYVIFTSDEVRICEALAESYPPQCGGDSLGVDRLDSGVLESQLTSVDTGDLDPEFPVRWTDHEVMLSGQMEGGRLQFEILVGS